MSLWKRGKRYWTMFTAQDGTEYRKPLCPPGRTRGTTNWQEATRLERVMIEAANRGELTTGPCPSFLEACRQFLEAKRTTARTERTVEFCEERIVHLQRYFGDLPLLKFTRERIEGYQAKRRADGISNRTMDLDVGVLRQVLSRFKQWRRLEDDVCMLAESQEFVGRVLTHEELRRLEETALANPEWEHVYCAAVLAANSSMRGVEIKHLRRKDVDLAASTIHIRRSKNEVSVRVLPLNEAAKSAVKRMIDRADALGHTKPEHYLWCGNAKTAYASKVARFAGGGALDPTIPTKKWDNAWRSLRGRASLPNLRFHDLRHTVVTELLEAGVPDHVVESITGHVSRRMLEHYSHVRIKAKKDALDGLDASRRASA